MISGNVPINSQPVIRPAVNGSDVPTSAFASRQVKPQDNLDTPAAGLAGTMASDPARARLFQEIEKDGGRHHSKDFWKDWFSSGLLRGKLLTGTAALSQRAARMKRTSRHSTGLDTVIRPSVQAH